MNKDIKNKKLSKLEFHALEDALMSQPGLGISATQDDQGGYQLDPKNMNFESLDAARNFLLNKDATSNLLGQARQQAGFNPVTAQESSENAAETLSNNPELGKVLPYPNMAEQNQPVQRKPAEEKKAIEQPKTQLPVEEKQSLPVYDNSAVLGNALQAQNENTLITNLLRATQGAGSALALARPDYSGVEALEKTNALPVAGFEKQQQQFEKNIQINKALHDLNDEKALSNPNSDISKLSRETLKSIGVKVPDTLSADVLKNSGVNIGTLLGIKQSNETKKAIADIVAGGKEEAASAKAEQQAKPTDKQVSALTDLDKAISHVEYIINEKPNVATGPKEDIRNKTAHAFGVDDPKISEFRSAVGEQLAQYIKAISGAAVSEQEAKRLRENMPTMFDNDETFMVKAKRVLNSLKKDKEIYLDNLSKQGKNVANFQQSIERKPAENHKDDETALGWAKQNISNPQNMQKALTILKLNGII